MLQQQAAAVEEMRFVLYRYCLSLTHSAWDAEDLVQETCLRALPVMNGEMPHPNPTAYLLRTAKNIAVDQSRRQQRSRRLMQLMQQNETVLNTLYEESQEMDYLLALLIRHLSPLQRTVFLLKELFGYRNGEAAAKLSTSEGAVKAALHRARAAVDKLKLVGRDEWLNISVIKLSHTEKSLLHAYANAIRDHDPQALVVLANAEEQRIEVVQAFGQLNQSIQSIQSGQSGQFGQSIQSSQSSQHLVSSMAGSSSVSMLFAA